jgi:hypothetical protein
VLRIFRRRRALCPHRSERYRRCSCPIYVEGSLGGESVRRSIDQTSWEDASDLIAAWTASGKVGVIRVDVPSIVEARREVL